MLQVWPQGEQMDSSGLHEHQAAGCSCRCARGLPVRCRGVWWDITIKYRWGTESRGEYNLKVTQSFFLNVLSLFIFFSPGQWNATTLRRTAGTQFPRWEPEGSTWAAPSTRTWFTQSEEETTPQSWAALSDTTPGPTSGLPWWPWRPDGAGWVGGFHWEGTCAVGIQFLRCFSGCF